MIYLDTSRVNGGGLGRYTQELIKRCDIYDYYIGDINILRQWVKDSQIIDKEYFISHSRKILKADDILHLPANNMDDLCITEDIECKIVLTVHDVIPLVIKEKTKKYQEDWRAAITKATSRADMIITVSKHSKCDMIRLLGISEDKIVVIYNGVNECFYKVDGADLDMLHQRNKKFKHKLLSTGSLLKHKNFWRILISFRMSKYYASSKLYIVKKSKLFRIFLICLGMGRHTELIGGVRDEDLNLYYNFADIFLFPSLYEGFGIPPLEAMACGTPVICTNTSCLPEIVENAAYMVNPYNIKEIINAIDNLEEDPDKCRVLVEAGMRIVKRYSWEETANRTKEVFIKFLLKDNKGGGNNELLDSSYNI